MSKMNTAMTIIIKQVTRMIRKCSGGHEAIRPCRIEITNIDEDECYTDQEKRVYHLIWKRTVIVKWRLVR